MDLASKLRSFLYDPRVKDVDVDDEALLALHRQILFEKPLMRHVFEDFYNAMTERCERYFPVSGQEVELGSGAGFFKKMRSQLITSDVRLGSHIDRVLDAQNLELEDNSTRCIFAINVFHHLSDPEKFFSELKRVLVTGGGCILIEPHHGPVSELVHSLIHKDEYFDKNSQDWCNVNSTGPLSQANQALAYMVFHRDRERFQQEFGDSLELLETTQLHNGLRYLAAGGINFRQLVPSFSEIILRKIEWLLSPLSNSLALHQLIAIRKR